MRKTDRIRISYSGFVAIGSFSGDDDDDNNNNNVKCTQVYLFRMYILLSVIIQGMLKREGRKNKIRRKNCMILAKYCAN